MACVLTGSLVCILPDLQHRCQVFGRGSPTMPSLKVLRGVASMPTTTLSRGTGKTPRRRTRTRMRKTARRTTTRMRKTSRRRTTRMRMTSRMKTPRQTTVAQHQYRESLPSSVLHAGSSAAALTRRPTFSNQVRSVNDVAEWNATSTASLVS